MGKYIALLSGKAKGTLQSGLLEQHVAHLKRLRREGVLFLCGPFRDNDGAIQILTADCLEQARAYVESDPFVRGRYYTAYTLSELLEANEENNYLMDSVQTKGNLE